MSPTEHVVSPFALIVYSLIRGSMWGIRMEANEGDEWLEIETEKEIGTYLRLAVEQMKLPLAIYFNDSPERSYSIHVNDSSFCLDTLHKDLKYLDKKLRPLGFYYGK